MTADATAAASRARRPWLVPLVLGLTLVVAIAGSLAVGVYPVPLATVVHVLGALIAPGLSPLPPGSPETERVVVTVVRLPRVVMAALAGAGLGMAGAAMQGLFRNPLVGPDLIGISSGASAGAALAILLSLPAVGITACAWVGAVAALALVLLCAQIAKRGGLLALILAGVVVSSLLSAVVGLAEYLADPQGQLPSLIYWLLGSFAGADPGKVALTGATLILGGVPLLILRWRLNLLSLDGDDADTLARHTRTMRLSVIGGAALIVAGQVSVSGNVGWVGLIVPHFARMLVGADHRRLLPAAALIGALLTVVCDDLARSIAGREIPIGLVTSLIGTPVFLFVFWRTQARGFVHA